MPRLRIEEPLVGNVIPRLDDAESLDRLAAAVRAISSRRSGVIASARAFPPFKPPLTPERDGGWVFALLFRRRITVISFARGDIDQNVRPIRSDRAGV